MAAERTPPADWKILRQNTRDRLWAPGNLLRTTEKAVGEVLCRHAPNMFPAYDLIAAEAGCCIRAVQNAMRVLCDGDPQRGLPPLFVRRLRTKKLASGRTKRHPGYEYEFVRSPEAVSRKREQCESPKVNGAERPTAEDRMPEPYRFVRSTSPACGEPADDAEHLRRIARWAHLTRTQKSRTESEIIEQVNEEFPDLSPLVKSGGDD